MACSACTASSPGGSELGDEAGNGESTASDAAQTGDADSSQSGPSDSTTGETSTEDQGESDTGSDTQVGNTDTSTDSSSEGDTTDTGPDPDPAWVVLRQLDANDGAMMSVWGPDPEQVFVVGGQIQPSSGRVFRFDGLDWIAETLPPATPMLDWVYGVDDRVWAVGRGGAILVRDDQGWSAEVSPTNKTLWGLWGASADELWAVGGDGTSDAPLLLRRDGASETWSTVELPDLGVISHGLFKVWGTSSTDVWAIGDRGATLHWDGASWTAHPSEAGIDLISLWGSPSEGLIAAGGRASGHLARLEGETWIGMTLVTPGLNGMWVDPAGPITAVGVGGTILSVMPGGFEVIEEDSPTPMVLHAVYGFSGGPRFAVGGSLLAPPPYIGVILGSG